MISRPDLRKLAETRIADADCLHGSARYDGAMYLCGYAVELALKGRICDTLQWPGFPDTNAEFKNYSSFRVHNLDVLLSLTGREGLIKSTLLTEWSTCATWGPDVRYKVPGNSTESESNAMIEAAKRLISAL